MVCTNGREEQSLVSSSRISEGCLRLDGMTRAWALPATIKTYIYNLMCVCVCVFFPFILDVQVGQSLKTVGYGCTSCWGDVGAGDAKADVIYISFIVSVQYIGY